MNYSELSSNEEKLDMVLRYVVSLGKDDLLTRDSIAYNMDAGSHVKEISEVLLKLYKDGYVHTQNEMGLSSYVSNFDGRIFIQNGGYVRKKETDDETANIIVRNENRRLRNDHLLIVGTWFAGIAALLLFLWQFFLYFYPVHKDYPYWFWEKIPVSKHK